MDDIVRGNLFEEFETPIKADDNPKKENGISKEQTLKVYLRVRPHLDNEQDEEKLTCFQIDDKDQQLTAKAPKGSFNFKNAFRGCSELQHTFTFSKIFGPQTGQKGIFDQTVLQSVKDCVNGKNALIFTYGVTNSGKSYTINGSSKDTGILPRAVDVIFNSIGDQLYTNHRIKTLHYSDFTLLNEKEQEDEATMRSKILGLLGAHEHKQSVLTNSSGSSCENSLSDTSKISNQTTNSVASSLQHEDSCVICSLDREIEERYVEDTVVEIDNLHNYKYAIWVSYAEIYNEQIFDLLVAPSKKKKEKRHVLRQKQDQRGNVYIKDLKEVLITDRQEAYKLFKIGQRNQQIAATKLNQQSSRSHCLYNLKIVQILDGVEPEVVNTSQLCFVDLAGSERQNKTQALGVHIGEAGKINNSLMTLGKCIETIRYNQYHRNHPRIVPFRESQLTRWLQNHFAGHGLISMIVNISPCTQVYDETLHVLKFSAIAKQVTTLPKPEAQALPLMPRISIAWENNANISIEKEESDSTDTRITGLLELIELLKDALMEKHKELDFAEEKARKEVAEELQQQFEKRQADWREYTKQLVALREEKYERKIELLQNTIKKRKRQDSNSDDDISDEYDSLEETPAKNDSIKTIKDLEAQVNNLTETNKKLESDINGKSSVENSKIYELQLRNEELQKMVTERELKLRAMHLSRADTSIQTSPAESPKNSDLEKDAKLSDLEDALREKHELVQFLELELTAFKNATEEAEASAAVANENLKKFQEQYQLSNVTSNPQDEQLINYKNENQELMKSVAELTRTCETYKMEIENMHKNEKEHEVALNNKTNLIENLTEQLKHSCQESGKLHSQLSESEATNANLATNASALTSKLESMDRKIQYYEEEFIHYKNLLSKYENDAAKVNSIASQTESPVQSIATNVAKVDQSIQCNSLDEIMHKIQELEEKNLLLQETIGKKCGEVVFLEDSVQELKKVNEGLILQEKISKSSLSEYSDLQVQITELHDQLNQLEESEQRKSTKIISMESELKDARKALNEYKEQFEKTSQSFDDERATATNEINSLKDINKMLQQNLDMKQHDLQCNLDNNSQTISELRDQMQKHLQEKQEQADKIVTLLQQKSDFEMQISGLNAKDESNSKTLCAIRKELKEQTGEFDDLKAQYQSCCEQLRNTENNLKEVITNFEELTADTSSKSSRINDLTKQLDEANKKLSEISEAGSVDYQELESLRSKYNVTSSDLELANAASAEAKDRLVSLTKCNEELSSKIEELTSKMNEKEQILNNTQAEVTAMAAITVTDKDVISNLKSENSHLINRIEILNSDISVLNERNNELSMLSTKYEEKLESDEKRQQKIDNLTKENQELIATVKDMENKILELSQQTHDNEINVESLEKMKEELKEIHNKHQNLEEEHKDLLNRHMRTIQLAKDKDEKLDSIKSEEIAQRQRLRNQLNELREELDKSEATLDEAVKKSKFAEERVVQVEEEVTELRSKYNNLLKELSEKDSQVNSCRANSDECEKQYLKQIAELKQSENDIRAALKSSEASVKKLSAELDNALKENIKLSKDLENLETNLKDADQKVETSADEITTLKRANEELIKFKKILEDQVQDLENRLKSDEIDVEESKTKRLERENKLEEELSKSKNKIMLLEGQVKSLEQENKSEIESRTQAMAEKLQSIDNIKELRKKLQDNENAKAADASKYESLDKQRAKIFTENDNLHKVIEALKEEIVQLNEDVEAANQALDKAQENEQKMMEWRKEKDDIVGQFRAALKRIMTEKEALEKEKLQMARTITELENETSKSEKQASNLYEMKEKMQKENEALSQKLEKISSELKRLKQKAEVPQVVQNRERSITNGEQNKQDETLVRASTPQILKAENYGEVHTPKGSEVIPKTANISKIVDTTQISTNESTTATESSRLSEVQASRDRKSVAAAGRRTRRKHISNSVEESEENTTPPKLRKLDNLNTPTTGRSMRSAKAVAIANMAETNESPSRIPLSLKGEENSSTSKKRSSGKRGIHKVMNNFIQNSPLRRSSKKKVKEEKTEIEHNDDNRVPPAKPRRRLHKVQDFNEFTGTMEGSQRKETNKTTEIITRQLRPRRR